ncbi:RagB/SusD family nutrient uptake outer membrane protein [Sphingobacterium athyrii]|uniref:RagB/SusD family nutrient uptake outer membrane protein n=1 Tax=Sphingobacterium athyrii TaxID=2152717 RepID=A0A363NZK3_9SPHI|nr:RagB/SusD family nutrient uptake outer membrane protein [Sphingobacterium athyrii]PUV26167.1 RagB/SusD family nutrient uptake outer membrane protein [Sphingobacterium athyrii]
MKYLNQFKTVLYLVLIAAVGGSSCTKGLDYENTGAINPKNVWTDSVLIKAYLNDVYGGLMPGWQLGSGANADEGINGSGGNLGSFQQGIVDVATNFTNLDYTYIDKANYFMDQLVDVPESVISTTTKNRLVGEAKFWRAWKYWDMVRSIGGVPLILHTQNGSDINSLKVPRSKTSECIAQIIKDLDESASVLPPNYSGVDYGRINRAAALGLKARVLLWYASPLFNATNDQTRWTNAYNAAKAAVQAADAGGFGLFENYRLIWYSRNKEQIMTRQYYYPDSYMNFAPIRPIAFTNGSTNNDQPILPLLIAYPKRDGSPIQFDQDQLSNPAYNKQFLTDFYTNRDDRFYATIWCGGTVYPTPDVNVIGMTAPRSRTYWQAWTWKDTATPNTVLPARDNSLFSGISPLIQNGDENGVTGFFQRKGLDTLLDRNALVGVAANAKSWFSPMRYAELLLNLAESANETGRSGEALNALYAIRKRAGIAPGTATNYGVTATGQVDIRQAIMNERQVELAFEGFRYNDLRRWKRYDILNTQGTRRGLLLMLNKGQALPGNTDNIMNAAVRTKFSAVVIENLDKTASANQFYKLSLKHWFNSLNPAQISIEPDQLPQNKEWGGTFDPLQ